jgi:hypothetical protein
MIEGVMSEEFPTVQKEITIVSCGDHQSYFVQAVTPKGKRLAEGDFPHAQYAALLKQIWESVLTKGAKPKLIGYEIPNKSLASETLHFLSPMNLGQHPPMPCREDLIYWLMANKGNIMSKMPDIPHFQNSLEYLVEQNIKAKRIDKQPQTYGTDFSRYRPGY